MHFLLHYVIITEYTTMRYKIQKERVNCFQGPKNPTLHGVFRDIAVDWSNLWSCLNPWNKVLGPFSYHIVTVGNTLLLARVSQIIRSTKFRGPRILTKSSKA